MARLIDVSIIVTERLEGDGKNDPYRHVMQWFAPDGMLLLEYDPTTKDVTYGESMAAYLVQKSEWVG